MATVIHLPGHATAIVDHDGQLMHAGSERSREVKSLGSRDVIGRAYQYAIHIHLRGLGTLQCQVDILARPLFGDGHRAAIPRPSLIGVWAREMSSLALPRYSISLTVGIGSARKHNRITHRIVRLHQSLPIKGKLPYATQVDIFLVGST